MSSLRGRLLLFGYPLLEDATLYLVAQWIGWGWTLLAVLISIPVGFAIMRNAGDGAMADMVASAETGQPIDSGRHGMMFVGGLLVAIPGFWSDLIGLLLVIPWTQRLFRAKARAWMSTRLTTVHMPGIRYPNQGDVIQGTVVRKDEPEPPASPPPPELQG